MICVPIKRKMWTQRQVEGRQCEDASGEGDHLTGMMHLQAQEHQKLPENHQKLRGSRKRFLYSFQWEKSPVDTLILDFYPPDLWKNKFLLF